MHDIARRGVWPGIDSVTGHGAKMFKSMCMHTLCPGTHYNPDVRVSNHSDKLSASYCTYDLRTNSLKCECRQQIKIISR